jgi:hypothetical protein
VELYHRHTPRTCYNIAALAHEGYYDGEYCIFPVRNFKLVFKKKKVITAREEYYIRRDRVTSDISLTDNNGRI